jgi:hypothetical protein
MGFFDPFFVRVLIFKTQKKKKIIKEKFKFLLNNFSVFL